MTFNTIKSRITEYVDTQQFIDDLRSAISYELNYSVSEKNFKAIMDYALETHCTYTTVFNCVVNIITIVKLFTKEYVCAG